MERTKHDSLATLLEVIKLLRDPEKGCPWDIKQTHASLSKYITEEAYELSEALQTGDAKAIKEELGDVLLQVLLNSQIKSEEKLSGSSEGFDFFDVVASLEKKLVERHPHVFDRENQDNLPNSAEEVKAVWQKNKQNREFQSLVGQVPKSLPALSKAQLVSERMAAVGFEWESLSEIIDHCLSEVDEFLAALKSEVEREIDDELGDIFFCLVQISRTLGLNAESVLQRSNQKFIERVIIMESIAKEANLDFISLNIQEKDKLWQKAKQLLKDKEQNIGPRKDSGKNV
jgi:MazG family protein